MLTSDSLVVRYGVAAAVGVVAAVGRLIEPSAGA